ncbi:hypothetical protein QE152_g31279 [Popillia japonica]|uniref:Uncharacterized protein n=1 Tax=Popillia japonica TaxID=7064 RepID=A0AAW1JAF5_POPJA
MKQEIPDERNKRRRRNGRTKQTSLGREENREAYRIELRKNCQDLQIWSNIEESWAVLREEAYRIELRKNCQDLQIWSNIEESWAVLRDKILESAPPFEMRNKRQRKEWFDKDCERELEYKRKLRLEITAGKEEKIHKDCERELEYKRKLRLEITAGKEEKIHGE